MCVKPLDGWLSKVRTPRGKRSVVFDLNLGMHDRPVTIPCGRCRECLKRRKRAWALRCQHEASLHIENTWLSLTYDGDSLPENGSLRKKDLSDFLKRLRSHEQYDAEKCGRSERRFKFFGCGEYGGRVGRAHYHIVLFGYDFADKRPSVIRKGYQQFESELLERIWDRGICEIGEVSFDGLGYVAKYVAKTRKKEEEEWLKAQGMEPEFVVMSRGGRHGRGIGYEWWKQYGSELIQFDSCLVKGKEVSVPPYYDHLNEISEPEEVQKIKARRKKALRDPDKTRSTALRAREKELESRETLFGGL